jgi:SSS family solute:Na+ symporter
MLWVYYTKYESVALASLAIKGQIQTDRVFPHFVTTQFPIGLRGLLIATVVAAGMSTLSSSLNSSAASTVGDFYLPFAGEERSSQHYVQVSRWITVGWGMVQLLVALASIALSRNVVDEVLGIQSLTGGLILGVFGLGHLKTTIPSEASIPGLAIGAVVLIIRRIFMDVSWQWYALIEGLTTYLASLCATVMLKRT